MIILDGKLDVVIAWRKRNWSARAFGVSVGQLFLGLVAFKPIPKEKARTVEQDFDHFLSYSGSHKKSPEIIAAMRKGFEAAWNQ